MQNIKYFIPEDGDDMKHPNIFRMRTNSSQITLTQLKQFFPVPGSYHFRGLTTIGSNNVWLDVIGENSIVPTKDGEYFLKVSRIGIDETNTKNNAIKVSGAKIPPTQPEVISPLPSSNVKSGGLINFDDDISSIPISSPAPDLLAAADNDLLGLSVSQSTNKSSNVDLFGLDSFPAQPLPTAPSPTPAVPISYFPPPSANPAPSKSPMSQQPLAMGLGAQGMGGGHPMGANHQGVRMMAPPVQQPRPGVGQMGGYDAFSGLTGSMGMGPPGTGYGRGSSNAPPHQQQNQRRPGF